MSHTLTALLVLLPSLPWSGPEDRTTPPELPGEGTAGLLEGVPDATLLDREDEGASESWLPWSTTTIGPPEASIVDPDLWRKIPLIPVRSAEPVLSAFLPVAVLAEFDTAAATARNADLASWLASNRVCESLVSPARATTRVLQMGHTARLFSHSSTHLGDKWDATTPNDQCDMWNWVFHPTSIGSVEGGSGGAAVVLPR